MNECTVECLSSDRVKTEQAQIEREPFVKIRARVLLGYELLLSAIESAENLEGTHKHFSKGVQMDRIEFLQSLSYKRY